MTQFYFHHKIVTRTSMLLKKFIKILTFINNINFLDLYPSQQIILIVHGFYNFIIQNLPVPVKISFLCVCSLLFELRGDFSENIENEQSHFELILNFRIPYFLQ